MNIKDIKDKNEIIPLLAENSLKYEQCDKTLALYESNKVVGTISCSGNVIKMFAISKSSSNDSNGALLIQEMESHLLKKYQNFFLFTSSYNEEKFSKYGYKTLVEYNGILLMEKGLETIEDFISNLTFDGAIVMNANPFTNGHKHLVKYASEHCDKLVVFVVETNLSSFDFETRFNLVKQGIEEFKNVTVLPSKDYMVSQVTFPTYFIKEGTDTTDIQQNLDAHLFGKWFSKTGIKKRFVGKEPFSTTTRLYNETLKKVMPLYGITLIEIDRIESEGTAISASEVRKLLLENDTDRIQQIVPKDTFNYLVSPKSKDVVERLKNAKSRH